MNGNGAESRPAIMFGILRNPDEADAGYELVYFDLLTEEESEAAFERLQHDEIVFNGYFPVEAESPNGIGSEAHQQISDIVRRLNQGEELTAEAIRRILSPYLL